MDEWLENSRNLGGLPPYLRVEHQSGEGLIRLFQEHGIFAILRSPHVYLEFAMPLKLFEALGHRLPILITRTGEAARFVEQEGIGWVVDEVDRVDWGKVVSQYSAKVKRIEEIMVQHTWSARALEVAQQLESRQ
jgi:glycosyltransferase involved in cell wall biosynthesis